MFGFRSLRSELTGYVFFAIHVGPRHLRDSSSDSGLEEDVAGLNEFEFSSDWTLYADRGFHH